MQFDINLILVPVTLVLFLIWLFDVLWLKQHKKTRSSAKHISVLEQSVKDAKENLNNALKTNAINATAESFVPNHNTDVSAVEAYEHYAKQKKQLADAKKTSSSEHFLVQWAYDFLPVLVFIVVLRAFVGEIYNIPSSSMVPTLYTGDFILVNKAAYGLRLPLIHTKILDTGTPKNGDVVVFRYPNNEKLNYIKRVIGIPGDTIAFANNTLTINGVPVTTTPSRVGMDTALLDNLYPKVINGQALSDEQRLSLATQEESYAHYYRENLGTHQYQVRYLGDLNASQYAPFLQANSSELATSGGRSWQITVPEGKYFVMGDNRDRSEDARFWGFVDDRQLGGRATHILFHKNPGLALPSLARTGKID